MYGMRDSLQHTYFLRTHKLSAVVSNCRWVGHISGVNISGTTAEIGSTNMSWNKINDDN